MELGAGLSAAELAGGFAIPDATSIPRRIQDQYLARLHTLPQAVQQLVLVAAADPVGNAALLQRAAAHTRFGHRRGRPGCPDTGLLDISAGVRSDTRYCGRRPIGPPPPRSGRRTAHAGAGGGRRSEGRPRIGGPGIAPQRQFRPDEQVAADDGSADRAERRGGAAAAAAFWERAVALTPDPGQRAIRALAAADAKYAAADFDVAQKLLITADVGPLASSVTPRCSACARTDRVRAQPRG